jgi:endonuclease/exonuclease/phosphatase family metal-dependent hydrolase
VCLLAAVALFLAAACARPVPDVTPDGPVLLAVVAWNMHAGSGELPQLLDDLSSGELTGSPPRDYVLLLQEAIEGGDRDVRQIAASRQLSSFFSPVRRSRAQTSGNAILSTLPLQNVRVVALPQERQPRGAVIATIEIASQRLFVVCTHLENRLGWLRGLFGDRARGRQAEALLREIPPQGHGIVGGDLNTMLGPNEPAWRALLQRFPEAEQRRPPTFRERLVLDHLFFDLPDHWTVTRRVVEERYGSDHHPVLALVRLKPDPTY